MSRNETPTGQGQGAPLLNDGGEAYLAGGPSRIARFGSALYNRAADAVKFAGDHLPATAMFLVGAAGSALYGFARNNVGHAESIVKYAVDHATQTTAGTPEHQNSADYQFMMILLMSAVPATYMLASGINNGASFLRNLCKPVDRNAEAAEAAQDEQRRTDVTSMRFDNAV